MRMTKENTVKLGRLPVFNSGLAFVLFAIYGEQIGVPRIGTMILFILGSLICFIEEVK